MSEPSDIKKELIKKSEYLVDLSESLEDAIQKNDEQESKGIIQKLDVFGSELVQKLGDLEGDDKAYANFMLGSLCSVLHMWPQAEDAYKKALDHWPNHVGLLNELFLSLVEQENYKEACETIEKSIKVGGETPDVLQNYAVVLVRLDRINEAKIQLIKGMAKFPQDQGLPALLNEIEQISDK